MRPDNTLAGNIYDKRTGKKSKAGNPVLAFFFKRSQSVKFVLRVKSFRGAKIRKKEEAF